jgi:hypothetical protein
MELLLLPVQLKVIISIISLHEREVSFVKQEALLAFWL